MRGERRSREPSRPRRQKALASIGKMKGLALPKWRTRLRVEIVGNIDCKDEHGLIVHSRDVEAQIACNPFVNEIVLVIDSDGGDVEGGLRIHHALMRHRARKLVFVTGHCCSAAMLCLLAADHHHRVCSSSAVLLLHGVSITPTPGRRWTKARHMRAAAECERTDAQLLDIYAQRTGTDKKVLQREMWGEGYTSVARAIELGFVDYVNEAIRRAG